VSVTGPLGLLFLIISNFMLDFIPKKYISESMHKNLNEKNILRRGRVIIREM